MSIINHTFEDLKMPIQYKTGVITAVLKPANPPKRSKRTPLNHCKLHVGKPNRERNVTTKGVYRSVQTNLT